MKKLLSFLMLFLLSIGALFAQDRTITGKVTDATDGTPIPGVNILIKGSTSGTTTNNEGNYTLQSVPSGATLVFSFIGFQNQEIASANQSVINVQLQSDTKQLNEVVVTAIGIERDKKALGYSVQQIKSDELGENKTNLLNSLAGKIAGAQITSSTGAPGASVNIVLRGYTSINGNNQPLFVIDGVPFNNDVNNTESSLGGVANSNRAIDINPDDIASVSVLKGPAAAALYGIQASNGAIVITTKRGSNTQGKVSVDFSSSVAITQANKFPELSTTYTQGSGGVYQGPETGQGRSWGPKISDLVFDGSTDYPYDKNGKLVLKTGNPNGKSAITYDPLGQFYRNGLVANNSISISAGNEKNSIRFAIADQRNKGIAPNTRYDRTSVRLTGDSKLTNQLSMGASFNYVLSSGKRAQQGSNTSGIELGLYRSPINFDNSNGNSNPKDSSAYYLPDGTQRAYRAGGIYDNPYWVVNNNLFEDNVNRFFGSLEFKYDPVRWLNITYRIGADAYTDKREQPFALGSAAYPAGRIIQDAYLYRHINSDLLVTFKHKIGDNINLSLLLGQNIYTRRYENLLQIGDEFNFPGFIQMGNATTIQASQYLGKYRRVGYFGAFNIDYLNMIFLELTGRADKTSTLPLDNNTFFYPSARLSFAFSELAALKDNSVLSYGKLRAAYAVVGNDALTPLGYYPLRTTYYQVSSATAYQIADGWTNGVSFPINGVSAFTYGDAYKNSSIKPEYTKNLELGLELRFLKNRLGLDITYYNQKSSDQLLSVPVSNTTGYSSVYLNAGDITNKGIEIVLNATPIKTDQFSWNLTVNWAKNKSMVEKLAPGIDNVFLNGFTGGSTRAIAGQPFGSLYGYKFKRDANGGYIVNDNPNAGAGVYGFPEIEDKAGVIGNTIPDWRAGITNSFTYKGFTLSALFDIKKGGDIWNGTRGALVTFGRAKETDNRGEEIIWQGTKASDGSTNDIKVPLNQAWYTGNGGGFGSEAKQFVEDASWVRLREASLGYTFRSLGKTPFKSINISVFGTNLWLHTKYKGVDPETNLTGAGNAQGLDYFQGPNTRSFGISLKAGI
ncbi:SusC/RagA family TonB-linked outer membrane protein [Cytophagaceae bacterium YF14B1]|uniref:SusC/RagA family TonB-linked outer membrane protein n=1 Tax=Xanthocytophaga flava TaxID=3048013 RepID=A0AAE3QLY6_9BACT|nr:SusC/RagA family TonB-linked outer membrane protein [Xanthocytophaga flavus]MDJ1479818.1 SusC/RagA family TonB-linked outer membrane protein [Xanthocytophaga flavus]